jgi:hypothetical protein
VIPNTQSKAILLGIVGRPVLSRDRSAFAQKFPAQLLE